MIAVCEESTKTSIAGAANITAANDTADEKRTAMANAFLIPAFTRASHPAP